MTEECQQGKVPHRRQRAGWMLLLAASGLLALSGVAWFFTGPRVSWIERATGVPLAQFEAEYPVIVQALAANARQVGILYAAVGATAFLVALEGFRRGTSSAWWTSWALAAVLLALGASHLLAGEATALSLGFLGLGGLVVIGLALANGRAPRAQQTRPR